MTDGVTTFEAGLAVPCHPGMDSLGLLPSAPLCCPDCGMPSPPTPPPPPFSLLTSAATFPARASQCRAPEEKCGLQRAKVGPRPLGCLSSGKTPTCGAAACQRGSRAANSGCGWKIIWSSAGWHLILCEVSHPWQCISHPAMLSRGGLAGMSACSQPGLALQYSPFLVCCFLGVFFV